MEKLLSRTIRAAGWLVSILARMVAPSLVMVWFPSEVVMSLSMPLGPSDVRTGGGNEAEKEGSASELETEPDAKRADCLARPRCIPRSAIERAATMFVERTSLEFSRPEKATLEVAEAARLAVLDAIDELDISVRA